MKRFQEVDAKTIKENYLSLIGNDYALITVKDCSKTNMMTASWGFFGVMWNKNVVCIVVRPSRYTYDYLMSGGRFTLNFLQKGYEDVLKFCGTKSGRDYDKIKETGLTPIETDENSVIFAESKLSFVCKKLYVQDMKTSRFCDEKYAEATYPSGDVHTMFIAEIEKVYELKN